jgi:hypothetical protein
MSVRGRTIERQVVLRMASTKRPVAESLDAGGFDDARVAHGDGHVVAL